MCEVIMRWERVASCRALQSDTRRREPVRLGTVRFHLSSFVCSVFGLSRLRQEGSPFVRFSQDGAPTAGGRNSWNVSFPRFSRSDGLLCVICSVRFIVVCLFLICGSVCNSWFHCVFSFLCDACVQTFYSFIHP